MLGCYTIGCVFSIVAVAAMSAAIFVGKGENPHKKNEVTFNVKT